MKSNIYFKSFRKPQEGKELETSTYNLETKTYVGCQTLRNVLLLGKLVPNTVHFAFPKRLSVSCPFKGFTGSYRPEGVIFTAHSEPDFVVPFDLMALTTGTTFTSSDYDSELLEGRERFIFKDFDSMFDEFISSGKAIEALNAFRQEKNLAPLSSHSMNYNEACFYKDIEIKVLGLVGDSEEIVKLGEEFNLPVYSKVSEFVDNKNPN